MLPDWMDRDDGAEDIRVSVVTEEGLAWLVVIPQPPLHCRPCCCFWSVLLLLLVVVVVVVEVTVVRWCCCCGPPLLSIL